MTQDEVVAAAGPDQSRRTGAPGGRGPSAADEPKPARRGRKQDRTRDGAILDAAIEVLGEVGYGAMTMDMVALRAKAGKATVYRRWSSKEDLVLDAIARLKSSQVLDPLPDTGTLRGDLVALFRPQSAAEEERRDRAAAGLASMLSHNSALGEAAKNTFVDPWADAHRALMRRAVDRGEIPAAADVDTICQVLPTMAAYRALIQRKPFDRDFLMSSIDVVLMPALLHDPRSAPPG